MSISQAVGIELKGKIMAEQKYTLSPPTINIHTTIGIDTRYFSSDDFQKALAAIPTDRAIIYLSIDSSGGSLFQTWEIMAMMTERKEKTGCHFFGKIDSMACSAATLIYLNCDHRTITKEGVCMIHAPSANCYGNSDDFELMRKVLVESEDEMIEFYQKRLPKVRKETVSHWIKGKADNYFDANECLALGVSQQIASSSRITSKATAYGSGVVASSGAVASARERFKQEQKLYADRVARQTEATLQANRYGQGLDRSIFPERMAMNMIVRGLRGNNRMLTNLGKRYLEQSRRNR